MKLINYLHDVLFQYNPTSLKERHRVPIRALRLDNVLADIRRVARDWAINQQRANGVPSSVGVSHYMKKLHAFVTLPKPQDPRFLPPTHLLHESRYL
jgi:hypothetical protein